MSTANIIKWVPWRSMNYQFANNEKRMLHSWPYSRLAAAESIKMIHDSNLWWWYIQKIYLLTGRPVGDSCWMYFVVLHCWVNSSIVMLSYVWCNDDNDTIDVCVCVWRGWAIFWSNYSDFTRAWVYIVKRIWKLQSLFFPLYYDTMFNTQVSLSISCLLILFWLSYLPPVCRWSKHICCGYHHGDAHKKTSSNWL